MKPIYPGAAKQCNVFLVIEHGQVYGDYGFP